MQLQERLNNLKYFTLEEMTCKDGTRVPSHLQANAVLVLEQLDIIRSYAGSAIHIISGYRTFTHNIKVGGATRSLHLQSKAADIVCRSMQPSELLGLIKALQYKGIIIDGGLSKYPSFVHYDVGHKRHW